ncbi:MAG: hypothetical protein ACP5PW_07330 [Candidatus Dormibacteria bacterium]
MLVGVMPGAEAVLATDPLVLEPPDDDELEELPHAAATRLKAAITAITRNPRLSEERDSPIYNFPLI